MGGWELGARHSAQVPWPVLWGLEAGRVVGRLCNCSANGSRNKTLKLCEWMSEWEAVCEVPSIYATNKD